MGEPCRRQRLDGPAGFSFLDPTDLSGRKVMELNKGIISAGTHTIELETGNLEAGIYFYTMRAGNFVKTRQLVIRLL